MFKTAIKKLIYKNRVLIFKESKLIRVWRKISRKLSRKIRRILRLKLRLLKAKRLWNKRKTSRNRRLFWRNLRRKKIKPLMTNVNKKLNHKTLIKILSKSNRKKNRKKIKFLKMYNQSKRSQSKVSKIKNLIISNKKIKSQSIFQ